jgi:hypothetical protein
MVKIALKFFLLASSHRIPLQTSNVQTVNGTTGAAMSLIKKSDLKNHLSTRTGATVLPIEPSIHADATGYSEDGNKDTIVNAAPASDNLGSAPAAEAGKPKA